MTTIYLSSTFRPVAVSTVTPGDTYADPVWGDCRRLTAARFRLAAERAGKESDALLRLLEAVSGAAEGGVYDGMEIGEWYELAGMEMPASREGELEYGVCERCGARHWYGAPELRTLCFDCWAEPLLAC